MADKIQLDGKTYIPIADAASIAGVTEQQVRLLAGQGRVLLRAMGKKIYADFEGLQSALRSTQDPIGAPPVSSLAPAAPAPVAQPPAGVKIVVPTPPAAPIASTKPQVSGADATAIRAKFASLDTSASSLSKVSVMPRAANVSAPPRLAPALTSTAVPQAHEKTAPATSPIPVPPVPPVLSVAPAPIKLDAAPLAAQSAKPNTLEAALMPEVQKIAPIVSTVPSSPIIPAVSPIAPAPQPETKALVVPQSSTQVPAPPLTPLAPAKTPVAEVPAAEPARSKEALHAAATHMSSAELSAMGSITQSDVPVPSPLQGIKVPPKPLQSNIARSLSTTAAALAAFVFVIGTGIAAYEKSPQAVAFLASAGKQVAAVFSADPTVTYTSSNAPSGAIVADGSPSSNQALATAATIPGGTGSSTQPIYYVYNYPVIERVVQEVKYIDADSPQDWNAQLDALYQRIQAQIQSLNISTNTNLSQQYQVIAQTNNIDKLGSVTIDNNSIFSGGTITGSTLTDIASLDVDGDTTLAGLTVGDITASGSGTFSGAGTFSYVVASSTNATSTFNGALLAARAPTIAHTFASWNTGAADSAWWDAALVVNPASATGDSNLISAAVNGSVKFLVDAEGDVFVNNLTSVGSVTLSTTSASSFNVEGNTTLGDSISDTTTINGTLIVTGTTTASTVSGKFGVGTSTPWGRLSVLAADNASDPQFVVASSSAIGLIFNKSGYFGIGTSSPTNKLEVSGNTFLGGNLTVTGTTNFSGGTIFSGLASFNLASTSQLSVFQKAYFGATATSTFNSDGSLTMVAPITSSATGANTFPYASSTALTVSGTAYLPGSGIWNSSGNLGVGTTSPQTLAHIWKSGGDTSALLRIEEYGATGDSAIQFRVDNSASWFTGIDNSDSNSFKIGTGALGSADKFTITSTGNVGIGTTTPTAALTVQTSGSTGSVSLGSWSTNGTYGFLSLNGLDGTSANFYSSYSNQNLYVNRPAGADIRFGENNGTAQMTILTGGNVGIGTTSPYRKLSVTDTVAAAQASIAYDGTRDTQLQTDSSGDFILNPSGDDVRINDDNLWVCAGGSCPTGAPSGNGNLIVESGLGIGTSTPGAMLQVGGGVSTGRNLQVDSSGILTARYDNNALNNNLILSNRSITAAGHGIGMQFVLDSAAGSGTQAAAIHAISENSTFSGATADASLLFTTELNGSGNERMRITSAGNVGIGTTSPAQQLGVGGLLFVGANGATGMGTATSTFYGDIKIIGKLDVSTIDPVYTIDGVKWATYGHSTVGIKEEAVLKVVPTQWDSAKNMYAYTIDFDTVEKGSDLWLFYQVTDFGKDWDSLVTALAPAFDGRTYYEEDPNTKTLTIYASESAPVSVRLIANRYDFTKWGNLRPDQDGDTAGTHVIESKPVSGSTD